MGRAAPPPEYLATLVAAPHGGGEGAMAQTRCTMPAMSTSVTRRRLHPSVAAWVLLGVVALSAVATASVMVWAISYGDEPSAGPGEDLLLLVASVLFMVWALVPFAAMAATVLFVDFWGRGGRAVLVVLAVGVAALVAIAGAALADSVISESSTSALIFIFLPLVQLVVVLATAAAGFGLAALMRRRRRHQPAQDAQPAGDLA